MKERLCKLTAFLLKMLLGVFCLEEIETLDHLFFSCAMSWKLGADCLIWWNMFWCCPKQPVAFLYAWMGVPFFGFEKNVVVSSVLCCYLVHMAY